MLRVGEVLVLLLQLLQLALAKRKVFQLFELVAEQLVAGALLVAAVAQSLQCLAGLPPALCSKLYLARQFLAAAELIEQASMGVRLQQRLMLVLAVNIDEKLAQRLEITLGQGVPLI